MSAAVDTANLKAGFENPVLDSQATFRAALNAFSFPGQRQTFDHLSEPPAPLTPATAGFILTLADLDTPVWLDGGANVKPVQDFLRFHCGCPLTPVLQEASFAIITDAMQAPRLGEFSRGNELYPDRSATAVFQVPSFANGPLVIARGPGIRNETRFQVAGLPDAFWRDWAINFSGYPLGVDVLLSCGTEAIGLPRSISLEM
jgi:alpha-D-ribose 1-methylphosphonate 5-triphosphate synthase subunit PhnH